LDMEEVAKGEYWYGTQALSLNLVDAIATSDDLILKAIEEKKDVYHIYTPQKEGLKQKLAGLLEYALSLKSEKEVAAKIPLLQ
jgi:serine protease SohB